MDRLPLPAAPGAWALALVLGLAMLPLATMEARAGPSPWRVYLSWEGDPRTTIAVSAQLPLRVPDFVVEYGTGPGGPTRRAPAEGREISGGGEEFRYTANITGLSPGTTYYYRAGSPSYGWSPLHHFTTAPEAGPFTFLAVADVGTGANASATLRQMANRSFAFVLHAGDISYAGANGTTWDRWFALIAPVAADHSYMVVPGNHENGSPEEKAMFRERFSMPWAGPLDLAHAGPYYSFNYSNVHFVALAVDTPGHGYPRDPSWDATETAWLERDLGAAADDPAHPWIVAYLHFPLFTSSLDPEGGPGDSGGWPVGRRIWGSLFDRYHVALVMAGHKHNYERTYPVWSNGTVARASRGPYVDPGAPIYVVTGGGGESLQPLGPLPFNWSAARARTYEFFEVSVDGDRLDLRAIGSHGGSVLDSFAIIRGATPGAASGPRPPPPGEGYPLPTAAPSPPPGEPGGPGASPAPLPASPGPPWTDIAVAGTAGIALLVAAIGGTRRRGRRPRG